MSVYDKDRVDKIGQIMPHGVNRAESEIYRGTQLSREISELNNELRAEREVNKTFQQHCH